MTPDILTSFGPRLASLPGNRIGIRVPLCVETRAVDAPGAEPGQVMDFIASDSSLDRYGEVIEVGGWELDKYRRNPVVLDSHCNCSLQSILGRSLSTEVIDGRLVNRVEFALMNPLARMVSQMALGGFIRSESVGFIPLTWVDGDQRKGEPYRRYTRQELVEISLVSVPANPSATITDAIKSGAVAVDAVRAAADQLTQICSQTPAAIPSDTGPRAGDGDGGQWLAALREIQAALRHA